MNAKGYVSIKAHNILVGDRLSNVSGIVVRSEMVHGQGQVVETQFGQKIIFPVLARVQVMPGSF